MNSIPGRNRTANMVFAVYAQRVSSDIVWTSAARVVVRLPSNPFGRPVILCLIVQCDFGMKKVRNRKRATLRAPGAQGARVNRLAQCRSSTNFGPTVPAQVYLTNDGRHGPVPGSRSIWYAARPVLRA